MSTSKIAQIKELEVENAMPKKMYIEDNLKAEILTGPLQKKWWL
jgi:hypothetical protein